ncbi:MAG: protein-L-isoaspartate(D-aspartate) O-methyltransferase [Xanthomonadales bacterium]|nr:protein-L-isoaspartate(D-aspartate) O-methyltransferase [Xanthomonadales bacterium]
MKDAVQATTSQSTRKKREHMVAQQIEARGIRDERVLEAMREVPREAFVSEEMAEFAYEDAPLPIQDEQTISQPYIVALMAEALELGPGDRVLEIGAGSGYAAAVLSRIADEVFAIERHERLAELAQERCRRLGYDNVHVLHGDGTRGWPEKAPFHAITVAAGGPRIPESLREQLADGGRLVIPVGAAPNPQELIRARRAGDEFEEESLGAVRFVPLIGDEAWTESGEESPPRAPVKVKPDEKRLGRDKRELREIPMDLAPAGKDDRAAAIRLVSEQAEPLADIDEVDLDPLLERIGDARVVLLGEATHGTSEFYQMRARITRELVEKRGFNIVATESDWPDSRQVDRHVRHRSPVPEAERDDPPFSRFPTWMWRNEEFHALVDWLREFNEDCDEHRQVSVHGLDLYSLYTSIGAVLRYLEDVDPEAASVAAERYGCLTPWEHDPAAYGRSALIRQQAVCEKDVVDNLVSLLEKRLDYAEHDGERYFDATQNARLVKNAEKYYRAMYYGSHASWNLRDRHMFETLQWVLAHRARQGADEARAVVWEHNSHIGDAAATEAAARGEINVGHLARQVLGEAAYLIGFGTATGEVAAASDWGGEMERKSVRRPIQDSYEEICHASEHEDFLLPLRHAAKDLQTELARPRLERFIGVIYRPETERQSHYMQAVLPWQFDEYVFFDETRAVAPLAEQPRSGSLPDTYPFGL